jgi:hypothetical protein
MGIRNMPTNIIENRLFGKQSIKTPSPSCVLPIDKSAKKFITDGMENKKLK